MLNRRKLSNFIIEPKFQYRYLGFLIASSLIPTGLTLLIVSYFLNENYILLINLAALDPETTSILQWELTFLVSTISVTFLLYIALIAIIGVVFSHRIAGVIYKLRKTMLEITDGKKSKLVLREKDEFKGLAIDFNRMIETLNEKNKKSA